MISSDCDQRCATYDSRIHICYNSRFLPDRNGSLYKGFFNNEIPVTVKKIRKCPDNDSFFGELPFLTNSNFNRTPYLVRYYFKLETANSRLVVMERVDTNLEDLQKETLRKIDRLEMINCVCQGVNILHTVFRIVHRDINPSNVLLKKNWDGRYTAKLADSGISKRISETYRTPSDIDVETEVLQWMTPANLKSIDDGDTEHIASTEDDIFSLGMLCWYIYSKGKHPFGSIRSRRIHNIRNNKLILGDFMEENPAFQNLMRDMMNSNARSRPNIGQVIRSSIFLPVR